MTVSIFTGLPTLTLALPDPGDLASGGEHWLMPKAPIKKPNYGALFLWPRITLNSNFPFTLVGVH